MSIFQQRQVGCWLPACGTLLAMAVAACGTGRGRREPVASQCSGEFRSSDPPSGPWPSSARAGVPAEAEQRPVPVVEGTELKRVWLGTGATTAVLLHQPTATVFAGSCSTPIPAGKGIRSRRWICCGYDSPCAGVTGRDRPGRPVRRREAASAEGRRESCWWGRRWAARSPAAPPATPVRTVVDLSGRPPSSPLTSIDAVRRPPCLRCSPSARPTPPTCRGLGRSAAMPPQDKTF